MMFERTDQIDDLSAWLAEYGHLPKPAAMPTSNADQPSGNARWIAGCGILAALLSPEALSEDAQTPLSFPVRHLARHLAN